MKEFENDESEIFYVTASEIYHVMRPENVAMVIEI